MKPLAAALTAASLIFTGCGYVGGVLPPLANVPAPVEGLAAIQRGANIIAHFTIPAETTEKMPISGPLTLDLRAGESPMPWNQEEWAAHARKAKPSSGEKNLATYEIPAAQWAGKDVVLAARVIGANGKASAWSNLVVVPVIAAPEKPKDVVAAGSATGIRVTWRAAGDRFRVLRKMEGGESFTEIGTAGAPEYLDKTAEIGSSYSYIVQTFAEVGDHKEAQSELSDPVSITFKDTFPPAAPAGVRAMPSPNSIELSWDANSEPDLNGYRVYRSMDGGPFEKIADVNAVPAYSDRAVEHGKNYRYSITAIDISGNESARSAAVSAALQ